MSEITIDSRDPKAREEVEKLLHGIAQKCRGVDGWAAAYVKREDGSAQLLVAFQPTNLPPDVEPD